MKDSLIRFEPPTPELMEKMDQIQLEAELEETRHWIQVADYRLESIVEIKRKFNVVQTAIRHEMKRRVGREES